MLSLNAWLPLLSVSAARLTARAFQQTASGLVHLLEIKRQAPPPVASGLARVGLRSGPPKGTAFFLKELSTWFWGCYAAQRGQARSPQRRGGCSA